MWHGVGRMIPLWLLRFVDKREAARVATHVVLLPFQIRHEFRDYDQGTPSDTADNINEFFEPHLDFFFEQGAQELAAHVYKLGIPWPVKLAIETYSIYDYLAE